MIFRVLNLLRVAFCPRPGFQKRLWRRVFGQQPNAHLVKNFSELRAERLQIVLSTPLYSADNKRSPAPLTEGL
jgi:hypothetical protein